MNKAIIGKKLGMSQIFAKDGKVIPVTVVEAGPCPVVQKKTLEKDGYQAVQLAYGAVHRLIGVVSSNGVVDGGFGGNLRNDFHTCLNL